jgi:DNA mismatch endonuclease (patch repair protein)
LVLTADTTIVLHDLRPEIRNLLQSQARWASASEADQDGETLAPPPKYHIGSPSVREPDGQVVAASPPWTGEPTSVGRFDALVAAASETFSADRSASSLDHLDEYYKSVWKLALSLPLPYLKDHPFEIAGEDGLIALGFRFRLHRRDLPGKPDIVLPKHGLVIFVHGCFWHQHKDCRLASSPKTNQDYWDPKLQRNIERDSLHSAALREIGWRVEIVWECETRDLGKLGERLDQVLNGLSLADRAALGIGAGKSEATKRQQAVSGDLVEPCTMSRQTESAAT